MALTICRPCEWIRKAHDANRSLSLAFEEAESPWGLQGCCHLVPSAGQGAVQTDPTRWQPYLPNKPVSLLLQRPDMKTGSSGQGKKPTALFCEVSQDFQVFYILSEKGTLCMPLKKRKTTSRGTAWQFARVIWYFPMTKGHLLQAPKCTD